MYRQLTYLNVVCKQQSLHCYFRSSLAYRLRTTDSLSRALKISQANASVSNLQIKAITMQLMKLLVADDSIPSSVVSCEKRPFAAGNRPVLAIVAQCFSCCCYCCSWLPVQAR